MTGGRFESRFKVFDRARGCSAQDSLEIVARVPARVDVRRVGRQVARHGACRFDRDPNGSTHGGGQVLRQDGVAGRRIGTRVCWRSERRRRSVLSCRRAGARLRRWWSFSVWCFGEVRDSYARRGRGACHLRSSPGFVDETRCAGLRSGWAGRRRDAGHATSGKLDEGDVHLLTDRRQKDVTLSLDPLAFYQPAW